MKILVGIVAMIALAMLANSVLAGFGGSLDFYGNVGVVQCNSDQDCPAGNICLNSECVCDSNDGCPTNYMCLNHSCVEMRCGISVTATDSLSFGTNAVRGSTVYGNVPVSIQNTGNVNADLKIAGSLWTGGPGKVMNMYATGWNNAGGTDPTTYTALTVYPGLSTGNIEPSSSKTFYFDLTIPSDTPKGNYSQLIYFISTC
jgi:hypothetical protein